jgi:tRNA nucleotidyltransferase (CCA-adding enzyme)
VPSPPLERREIEELVRSVPEEVLEVCRRLRAHGRRGWIVGGCVRDLLCGAPVSDWDVATDARPEEVMRIFPRVVPTGLKHGTVTVLVEKSGGIEVTTLRGEGAYADGRRPESVVFLDDIVEDLARRDFTFNAVAVDPLAVELCDPFDGRGDLARRVVRAVGDPLSRFSEDGLRVLRAARFAATLACEIEPATRAAMGAPAALATLGRVSTERVRDEWLKAMRAARPSIAFRAMQTSGALSVSCPELDDSVGCAQNRWHAFDVWDHTMAVLDALPSGDAVLRVGALLHDVAKPRTRALSDKTGDYTFHRHELVGADMASSILGRLRFKNEDRARVVHLVRHHLVCYAPDWSDAAVRRWVRRVEPERVAELVALARADALGKGRDVTGELAALEELGARAEALAAAGAALRTADLAVDGNDLMRELGIAPGPVVGELLRALLELVLDDPGANERARLLAEARRKHEESGRGADGPRSRG